MLLSKPEIGGRKFLGSAITKLTDEAWRAAFLATIDEEGDMTHESFCFIRDNRYDSDMEDQMLEDYRELCHSNCIDF